MLVLGINCFSHDASAALVLDGKVLFHAEEERFDRVKHSSAFPKEAIARGLSFTGLKAEQIDRVAFFFRPNQEIFENAVHFARWFPDSLNLLGGDAKNSSFFTRNRKQARVLDEVRKHFHLRPKIEIDFVDHHLAHAASAIYQSGFSESAIIVWDGRGESSTSSFYDFSGDVFFKHKAVKVPHSLGHLYSAVTSYLGFNAFFDEWKVMGLSAYGQARFVKDFDRLVASDANLSFELNMDYFSFHTHGQKRWVSELFLDTFGPARIRDSVIDQNAKDIAFALQKKTEEIGLKLAMDLRKQSRSENLCLVGGVALNILLNSEIVKKAGFKNVFVMPVSSDAGTSVGAAQYVTSKLGIEIPREESNDIYWGDAFSNDEIEKILVSLGLKFRKEQEIETIAAKAISENKIIGWFQGRMESGPRALGNRSILANPKNNDMKDRINRIIKKRESFRPFAPSCLEESANRYFEIPGNGKSAFMILSGKTRTEYVDQLRAVTHVDGTARVHTVSKRQNHRYWSLISKVGELTGVPVVLNTSFNENEPIVCHPRHAIDCFLRTEMDCLGIGDFWLEK